MVLAQKQTHRSMEQNRKPREKKPHLYGQLIFDRGGEYTIGERQPLVK